MTPADAWEHADYNDVIRIGPRHVKAATDDLVASIRHRTTGTGRSALLTRAAAESLRNWLDEWLEQGWDGVARECAALWHADGCEWSCTLEPGDHRVHDGKAVYWRAETGKPGRRRFTADGEVA